MHPDDEPGYGYSNEFQAAYELSQRERKPDDRGKVRALTEAGRFVVIRSLELFCKFTDASLGEAVVYISDHATLEEAVATMPADAWEDLEVRRPPIAMLLKDEPIGDKDDIPF